MAQVQNMRQKLLEQDQLQGNEKESLRKLRTQMKNLMRKKGACRSRSLECGEVCLAVSTAADRALLSLIFYYAVALVALCGHSLSSTPGRLTECTGVDGSAGMNPLLEDYRKNRAAVKQPARTRGYGSFFCCAKGAG
jgi:hypothetical protein